MLIAFGITITGVEAILYHRASPLGLALVVGGIVLKTFFLLGDWGTSLTEEESEANLKENFPLVWFRWYGFEEFKNLYDLFKEESDDEYDP
jgi:hypothetical protein